MPTHGIRFNPEDESIPTYAPPPKARDRVAKYPWLRFLRIPNILLFDDRLNETDRLLMGCVLLFDHMGNHCFLSNATFTDIIGAREDGIQASIRKLRQLGLIRVGFEYKPGATIRHIYTRVTVDDVVPLPVMEHLMNPKEDTHTPEKHGVSPPEDHGTSTILGVRNEELSTTALGVPKSPPIAASGVQQIQRTRTAPPPVEKTTTDHVAGTRHPLVEYWNRLPSGRKHRDPSTNTYRRVVRRLKEIQTHGFANVLLDDEWRRDEGITKKQVETPLAEGTIRRALERLSRMLSPGFVPGPDSKVAGWGLDELIYNERNNNSFLLVAAYNEPAQARVSKTRNVLDSITDMEEREQVESIADDLRGAILQCRGLGATANASLNGSEWAQVCKIAADMYQFWYQIPNLSEPHHPVSFAFMGGVTVFGERYAEYVSRQYEDFNVKTGHISLGGRAWSAWIQDLENELGVPFSSK